MCSLFLHFWLSSVYFFFVFFYVGAHLGCSLGKFISEAAKHTHTRPVCLNDERLSVFVRVSG